MANENPNKIITLSEADLERILDRHIEKTLAVAEQRFYENVGRKIILLATGLLGAIGTFIYAKLCKIF